MNPKKIDQKVAIVGIGCNFSGNINSPKSFWNFLQNCGDGVMDVPEDRWDLDKFYDSEEKAPGKMYVKRGAFLKSDVYQFDANFFGITPREGKTLDPQQRLLMETAYEAFEDAGCDLNALKKTKTGVFMGGFMMDNFGLKTGKDSIGAANSHTAVSGSATLIANRLSHAFDLMGPSMTVDTACSSSMVAIHLACQSILNGDSDVAIAGGVNVMLNPAASIVMSKGKFLAKDGRSKAFYDDADGYGRGEGAGVIVLKSLEAAQASNDRIYAVIEGSAVNQDGKTDGIALPNQAAQIKVIEEVLAKTGIDPVTVDYVEAHGTGTKAGDPLELGALSAGYARNKKEPLVVGTVKINIGHTEAAAGVAGVIKSALMLRYGQLLPHMNLGNLSSSIPFDALNVAIPVEGEKWVSKKKPARIAVNSFGYGGTNGHLIMSKHAGGTRGTVPVSGKLLFRLSGKNEASLRDNGNALIGFLKGNAQTNLNDLAYSLNERRTVFDFVWLLQASTVEALIESLEARLEKPITQRINKLDTPENVWVFTGMGPQWYGMGQELYHQNEVFRAKLDQCDAIFKQYAGYSLLAEMLKSKETSQITKNEFAQAANFFVQVGLSAVYESLGFVADKIMGHSVGEIAAATVAGVVTLEEGVRIIYHRGKILEAIAGKGTLLAVGLSEREAQRYIKKFSGIEVATINAPTSVTLAGTKEALSPLSAHLVEKGIFSKFVFVEVAYHSSQMDPLKAQLIEAFDFVRPQEPRIPLYSSVTGEKVSARIQDAEYWWKNVRNQVFFSRTIRNIIEDGGANFIEVGPHPVLGPSIKEISASLNAETNSFFSLKRLTNELETVLDCLGGVIASGSPLALNPDLGPSDLLRLPAYAWSKELLWEQTEAQVSYTRGEGSTNPFLQNKMPSLYPAWSFDLNKPALRYIHDHQVRGSIIFPGAGYIESALSVLRHSHPEQTLILNELHFNAPLSFAADEFPVVQVEFDKNNEFEITSRKNDLLHKHVTGKGWTSVKYDAKAEAVEPILAELATFQSEESPYDYFNEVGLNYSAAFQSIQRYGLSPNKVIAELALGYALSETEFVVHPSLLDGAFQSLLLLAAQEISGAAFLPVKINELKVYRNAPARALCVGTLSHVSKEKVIGNLQLIDPDRGDVLVDLRGLECKVVPATGGGQYIYKYGFEAFECPENNQFSQLPVYATGSQALFETRLDLDASFVPLSEIENLKGQFQLLYCIEEAAFEFAQILDASRLLLSVLKNERLLQRIERFVLVMNHGLVDERLSATPTVNLTSSALVGFARVVMTELPALNCKTISLNGEGKADLNEIVRHAFRDEELIITQSGWAKGQLMVTDLHFEHRAKQVGPNTSQADYKLDVLQKGKLDTLRFRNFQLPALKEDEVTVEVAAASINFKDVMKAMGMLNEAALENTFFGTQFGLEGSGYVSELGAAAQGKLQPRDRVYFFGNGLRSKLNVIHDYVFKLPDHISFNESATFMVYFTAWIGLVEMGKISKGEKILIHSAAGGVGLSACMIARAFGAEVYATAGTPEKRAYLKSIGIQHVYDSRKLDFYDQITRDTQGEGVDLVLNSLAGEVLHKSLDLIKTLGRFIEIGKQDITNHQHLSLSPFNKSIQFIALDLDKIMPVAKATVVQYFENFLACYADGTLGPLPIEAVSLSNFQNGFVQLSSGSQIGKIVLNFENQHIETAPEVGERFEFGPSEALLITGGCSGFGLRTALWWAEKGVKHLILGSRRGVVPEAELDLLEQIESQGARVHSVQLDVTDVASIQAAVDFSRAQSLDLSGIVHAATVLRDSTIETLTDEEFEYSFVPKALGAWNLHTATRDLDLKYFILYSSVTSYLGNPGQLAYATANSFLDGLTHYRRSLGLNATSISWGSIGEVGILSRNKLVEEHLAKIGLTPVKPAIGLELMGDALLHFQNHIGIIDMDWERWTRAVSGTWERLSPLLESGSQRSLPPLVTELFEAEAAQHEPLLLSSVAAIISAATGVEVDNITPESKLSDQGLDSIMAVELTVDFQTQLGIELPVMEILGSGTVGQLVKNTLKKILALKSSDAQADDAGDQDLVEAYLDMICVQRPYFSLTEIEKEGTSLYGVADTFDWSENMGLNLSEAARNLALLGSCVVSDHNPTRNRHCYPVHKGKLNFTDRAYELEPGAVIRFYAELAEFDKINSAASAITRLLDADGQVVGEMTIAYHIIPEDGLYELFKESINEDPSWQDVNSSIYEERMTVDHVVQTEAGFEFQLDGLRPEQCVGHFNNLPAFPVSTMTRYVAELIRRGSETLFGAQRFKLVSGYCETEKFIFAGSSVDFVANFEGIDDETYQWNCSVRVGNEPAAAFNFMLSPESVPKGAELAVD